jgi:hypothetical protein
MKARLSKGRKILAVALVILIGLPIVAYAALNILIATVASKRHSTIVAAAKNADIIRLEEFLGSEILNQAALAPKDASEVLAAFPFHHGIGGLSVKRCFIPHHRIAFLSGNSSNTVTICFHCDQIRLDEGGIFGLPQTWREGLSKLFAAHRVPVRDDY